MCILIQMCAHGFVCPRMQRPKVNFRSLLWLLSTSISKTRSLTEFGAYRLCSAGWRMGFWDLPALTQCWGSRCKLPGFLLDISCLSSVSSTHSPTESPAATQKFVLYHAPLTHALNSTTRNQNKQANHNKNLSYFFLKKKSNYRGNQILLFWMHNKIISKNAVLDPKVSVSAIIKVWAHTHSWTNGQGAESDKLWNTQS